MDQAVDGQEPIMRLDSYGYAAMVLDLQMPKASGFDVIDHLARKNPMMDQQDRGCHRISA